MKKYRSVIQIFISIFIVILILLLRKRYPLTGYGGIVEVYLKFYGFPIMILFLMVLVLSIISVRSYLKALIHILYLRL